MTAASRAPELEEASAVPFHRWRAAGPLALVVVLFILPLAGSPPATNPNEVIRAELAVAIASLATFDLGAVAAVYGLSEDVSIRDGKIYSDKAPGLSLVSVPAVWLAGPLLAREPGSDLPAFWPLRHVLTLLHVALPAAGLAVLIAMLAPVDDRRLLIASAVIAALATPLWTYATVYFSHAPAALLVAAAWFLLLGPPGRDLKPTPRRAALGGAAAGFAVATEYPTALLVAVIFAAMLVRRAGAAVLLSTFAGAFAGSLPAMVYHQIAFGAPWTTGYSFKAASDMQAIIAHGVFGVSLPSAEALWGILFGARRGLFFYSPLLLLAGPGLWWMVRERGWRDAGPIAATATVYVLFAAGFVDWTAGWCAASRHLLPVVPLLAAASLFAAARLAASGWGMVLVAVLVAISGANSALTIVLTPFFPPEFSAPLAELVMPSLAEGAGFANIASAAFDAPTAAVAVLTGITALLGLQWAVGRLAPGRRAVAALAATAAVAAILALYSWQGSSPSMETELMRAQVLRRLGHSAIADRIEDAHLPKVAATRE